MIVSARIRFENVLKYLDVTSIPGCDDAPEDWIDFLDCVDVEDDDIPECDLCGGEGRDEVEEAVNDWLIADFIEAIQAGDIKTAQCLVGRVFELRDDVGTVDRALCARDTHPQGGDVKQAPFMGSPVAKPCARKAAA